MTITHDDLARRLRAAYTEGTVAPMRDGDARRIVVLRG